MDLAIYGAGGLGHEVLDLARHIQEITKQVSESIFFVVDEKYIVDGLFKNEYMSCPIYGFDNVCNRFSAEEVEFVIALGEPDDRKRLYEQVKEKGYRFKTLIHPSANISPSAVIGEGTIVQSCSTISSDAQVGKNCFFQSMALLGHDCIVNDHSVVSSHVAISGHVKIGDNVYIAPGVMVKDRLQIGSNSVIGMGSNVQRNIPDNVIALGNPARPMKHKDDKKVFR